MRTLNESGKRTQEINQQHVSDLNIPGPANSIKEYMTLLPVSKKRMNFCKSKDSTEVNNYGNFIIRKSRTSSLTLHNLEFSDLNY